jgi:hypothetical protein
MTKIQRAKVVRTLREAAVIMAANELDGMCAAVRGVYRAWETYCICREALDWLRVDSPRSWDLYWYAEPHAECAARAIALDMLASIIEAGDSLE